MFLWQRVAIQWKCFFTEFWFLINPFSSHCNKGQTSWEFETSEFDGGMSSEGGVWDLSWPRRPALLINLWGWVWGSELLRSYIRLHYVVSCSGDTVGWSWCRCELKILRSINIQGLDTSSYNLLILSRTRSSLVIGLKTLYTYACSFHDNINSL